MFKVVCIDTDVSHAWGWFEEGQVYTIERTPEGRIFGLAVRSSYFTQRILLSEGDLEKCFIEIEWVLRA